MPIKKTITVDDINNNNKKPNPEHEDWRQQSLWKQVPNCSKRQRGSSMVVPVGSRVTLGRPLNGQTV